MDHKHTVVGLFEDEKDARRVVKELISNGVAKTSIREITHKAGDEQISQLTNYINEPDVHFYQEGIRQGDALIMVTGPDRQTQQAAEIMARYNMVDVDARSQSYRTSGQAHRLRDYGEHDYVLPVVEEELQVGKREVERKRMRIYSQVTETPVQKEVHLRDESIHVERRPVNRAVTSDDMATLKEGSFEVTEVDEEPVVAKRARVVEEVVVSKDQTERTETIRDTLRQTDVNVEQAGAQSARGTSNYAAYENDFRNHYQQSFANSGYSYQDYSPVYQYGHDLAVDPQYRERDWATIEPDARQRWEARNPGTWDQFKDSVRYAWDRVRGRR